MKRMLFVLAGMISLAGAALAAGMWPGLPIVGAPSYCASFTNGVCTQTVPAGPSSFTGAETFPMDTHLAQGQQPQTVLAKATQIGLGASLVITAPATATIPDNTPYYYLNGTQGSGFTITMPLHATAGDIQKVICTAATVGALAVVANTGTTLSGNPATACVAGTVYTWRLNGTVWMRS